MESSSGVCVWGIGSKQNTCVSKANSASSHIWLKTKLIIDSEILRIDPESLERELRCMDGSIFSPTPIVYWAKDQDNLDANSVYDDSSRKL